MPEGPTDLSSELPNYLALLGTLVSGKGLLTSLAGFPSCTIIRMETGEAPGLQIDTGQDEIRRAYMPSCSIGCYLVSRAFCFIEKAHCLTTRKKEAETSESAVEESSVLCGGSYGGEPPVDAPSSPPM